jgi:hypothetical protein
MDVKRNIPQTSDLQQSKEKQCILQVTEMGKRKRITTDLEV